MTLDYTSYFFTFTFFFTFPLTQEGEASPDRYPEFPTTPCKKSRVRPCRPVPQSCPNAQCCPYSPQKDETGEVHVSPV